MAPPVPPFSVMAEVVWFCRSRPPVVVSTECFDHAGEAALLLISAAIDAAPSAVPAVAVPVNVPD